MCQACVDACREIFPEVPDAEMGHFLFGTTCYPFGESAQVREQLAENRQRMKTSDWRECYAIADEDLEEEMKQVNTDTKETAMLSERLGTTLTEAQAELDALKPAVDAVKAKLDKGCREAKAELNSQYRKKAKHLRALVLVLEAEAPVPAEKQPEKPAKPDDKKGK